MLETSEMQVRSLGWEDPLEEGMATHSSILAWRIPWTEEPGGLQSTGSHRVGHDWATITHIQHLIKIRTGFYLRYWHRRTDLKDDEITEQEWSGEER